MMHRNNMEGDDPWSLSRYCYGIHLDRLQGTKNLRIADILLRFKPGVGPTLYDNTAINH
jgi:hypothetical protein